MLLLDVLFRFLDGDTEEAIAELDLHEFLIIAKLQLSAGIIELTQLIVLLLLHFVLLVPMHVDSTELVDRVLVLLRDLNIASLDLRWC